MAKLKFFKLGTIVKDDVTGLDGMLTHFQIDMSNNINYTFQPAQLSPETHEPVDSFWLDMKRVKNAIEIEKELPVEVLGSKVKDRATGFSGTAVCLIHHISGCTHFAVKPRGIVEKTGNSIRMRDFDMRRLEGEKIPVLSDEEREESEKKHPSPADTHEFSPGKE